MPLTQPSFFSRESPTERLKSSGARSSDNRKDRSHLPGGNVSGGGGGSRIDRPAIPVKPSHLSPIVANGYKRSPSDLRPKLNSVTSKVNNSPTSPLIAEAMNGLITAASGKSVNSAVGVGKMPELSEVENVRLNLHPVASNNNTNKIHSESGLASKRAPSPTRGHNSAGDSDNGDFEEEEGVKRISADSIKNIRRDANVMSFQFTGATSPSGGLSHLPGGAAAPTTALSKKTEEFSARQSDSKKVGIFK